ncbi:type II secretion system protein J [Microbacterium sp. YJN-G]|uniref:PulJ/GspJ family protein n=1 Tax=Microbacterium sp. YJN-G TaxID=2763257 RepID=UPI00187828A5|nr:type II secretion system protein [Microbacterium sp. YJN-G]
MSSHTRDEDGFGLVEVVIAMFLLGIVAVAILPVLWSGIQQSSRQSATATATRELNALIEQARDGQTCAALDSAAATKTLHAGTAAEFEVRVPSGVTYSCTAGSAVPITLEAARGTTVLTVVRAEVYIP